MPAGFDQQASVRADYPVVRQTAGIKDSEDLFQPGVGKKPRRRAEKLPSLRTLQ
jgi:hypothetical protein